VPKVPLDAKRPVDIMEPSRLAFVAAHMPCVADPALVAILESPDTMWYDKHTIIQGYQDSAGDNVEFPIGFRPNTIEPDLIVTGGHEALFEKIGVFHFPFGRPLGTPDGAVEVVDFWKLPRQDGKLLPVVWWYRNPNSFTWRVEWIFPKGTVFGEILFEVAPDGTRWPFEIRTRTRSLDGWETDLMRAFNRAEDMAAALIAKRAERPEWQAASDISALIAHLQDPTTLVAGKLTSSNFPTAFAEHDGGRDVLPAVGDVSILEQLLGQASFSSARGQWWKKNGSLGAYAPTTDAGFHVVPTSYVGGYFDVSKDCDTCHRDAGHPFKDYYEFVELYGELWGGDEIFSWHPFRADKFVDADGNVLNFNNDNREIRPDFINGGVVKQYDPSADPQTIYKRIMREWADYSYL
jgi:hypothetical protein